MDERDGEELGGARRETPSAPGDGQAPGESRVSGPVTEGVRIAAVEAAVAAGLAPSTTRSAEPARLHQRPAGPSSEDIQRPRPSDGGAGRREPWTGWSGEHEDGGRGGPDPEDRAWATELRGYGTASGVVPAGRPDGELDEAGAPQPPIEHPGYVLPDWSDPPTGQVPRVLLDDPPADAPGVELPLGTRGPSWRESGSDWDDDVDLSFLSEPAAAGRRAGDGEPFDFSFADLEAPLQHPRVSEPGGASERTGSSPRADGGSTEPAGRPPEEWSEGSAEDAAWTELLAQPVGNQPAANLDALGPPTHRRHAARQRFGRSPRSARRGHRSASRLGSPSGQSVAAAGRAEGTLPPAALSTKAPAPAAGGGRNAPKAVLTGCAVGALALVAFLGGPLPTLVLLAVVVTLAAGEALGALRRGGFRPAAPLALLSAPALMVAAYDDGVVVLPVMLAASLFLTWCFVAVRRSRRAAADLGVSVLVTSWVGLLGAFGGALLAPATFLHRHGLAVLVAAVLLAVGNDVGAYAVGARLGRHKLAPAISPAKTWEGAVGGLVLTLLLAGLVAARIHPLDLERALLLGAVVCVLAPLGDLAESLLKRDLGVKDMGDLLPAHGGVLDRVDSILFVLPVAYYLAVAWHLG